MRKSYTVDEHTIEFSQGSSTLDPWCSEYCREIGLSLMCTSDITPYMMIDGEKIYHLRRHHHKYFDLIDALESDVVVVTWEDITTLWEDLFDDFAGNFSELKKSYDRMKKNEDDFKKLSPEEQKKVIEKWRADRKAEREKYKQENKK